jgi:hypothetical protein
MGHSIDWLAPLSISAFQAACRFSTMHLQVRCVFDRSLRSMGRISFSIALRSVSSARCPVLGARYSVPGIRCLGSVDGLIQRAQTVASYGTIVSLAHQTFTRRRLSSLWTCIFGTKDRVSERSHARIAACRSSLSVSDNPPDGFVTNGLRCRFKPSVRPKIACGVDLV